jgi:large subunit ribosomal protein L18
MKRVIDKTNRRKRRKMRVRRKINGTADRPRLSVFKSNRYLYVQVVDDVSGNTLTSINTAFGELKGLRVKVEDGVKLGEELGKRLKEQKIEKAVFDRNGYLYHGVVKAVADGTRKAGIEI